MAFFNAATAEVAQQEWLAWRETLRRCATEQGPAKRVRAPRPPRAKTAKTLSPSRVVHPHRVAYKLAARAALAARSAAQGIADAVRVAAAADRDERLPRPCKRAKLAA